MEIQSQGSSSEDETKQEQKAKRKVKKTRDAEFGHLKRELLAKLRLKHSIRKL